MKCRECGAGMDTYMDACYRCSECGHEFDPVADGGVWALKDTRSGKLVGAASWDEGRGLIVSLTDGSRVEGKAAEFEPDVAAALALCLNALGMPGSFEAVRVG